MNNALLILDKLEYKENEAKYMNYLKAAGYSGKIMYTAYEDEFIRHIYNYKYIGKFLHHILYWLKSMGYALEALKDNDIEKIFCINPIVGLFLGLYNRKKEIIIGGFLFEPKRNQLYYSMRKQMTKLLMRGVSKIVVYSSKEVEYYTNIFHNDKFIYIQYGIDFVSNLQYTNKTLPNKFLFSGGGSNRDYQTLIRAYSLTTSENSLIIATQPWRVGLVSTSKIQILSDVDIYTFGSVLRRAHVLILSLKNIELSAGHMVLFQAMDLCVPIIVNDIIAIRDYVDEKCVKFYSSGDERELSRIIDSIDCHYEEYKNRALYAKTVYDKELKFDSFLQRFLKLYCGTGGTR